MVDYSQVKEEIYRKEISMREISRRTNIDHQAVARFLKGKTNARIDTIEAILDAVGFEIKVVRKK